MDGSEYRTEIESFSKITAHGNAGNGPEYFIVKTKSGTIIELGKTEDSRIEAQEKDEVLIWYVNRIKDRHGNYIDYTYYEDNSTGEVNCKSISYTGNTANGLKPYNKIEFFYENSKFDKQKAYIYGSTILQTKLLHKLKLSYSEEEIETYEFKYIQRSYSLLSEIINKNKYGEKYNSTIFNYAQKTQDDIEPKKLLATSYNPVLLFGDFNNDGKSDIANFSYLNQEYANGFHLSFGRECGISSNINTYIKNQYIADFDGDGKDDILLKDKYNHYHLYYDYDYLNGTFNSIKNDYLVIDAEQEEFKDLDGDGITDCLFYYPNISTFKFYFGNNDINSTKTEHTITLENDWINHFYLADFTGDGLLDLLGLNSTEIALYQFNNDFTQLQKIWNNSTLEANDKIFCGDFNGDRKYEFIASKRIRNNSVNDFIFISTGKGFNKHDITETEFSFVLPENDYAMIDFNGDGKTDFIDIKEDKLIVYKFIGENLIKDEIRTVHKLDTNHVYFLDMNGDGYTDIVNTHINGFNPELDEGITLPYITTYAKVKTYSNSNMLTSITNGKNKKRIIEYKGLAENNICWQENNPSYPVINLSKTNLKVVDNTKTFDKDGLLINKETYTYSDPTFHVTGKGFLGFKEIIVSNKMTNTTVERTYNNDNPPYYNTELIHKLVKKNGIDILATDYMYDYKDYEDNRYFKYISSKTVTNFLKDITTTTTTNMNDQGNIEQRKVDYGGGIKTTTTYSDYITAGSWMKNKPKTIKVIWEHPDHSASFTEETLFLYNNLTGRVTKKITNANSTKPVIKEYFEPNSFGSATRIKTTPYNMPAKEIEYTYDHTGRFIVEKTNELGNIKRTFNPANGNKLTETDMAGLTKRYKYDGFGRLTKIIGPTGLVTQYELNWANTDSPDHALYYKQTIQDHAPQIIEYYDVFDRIIREEKEGYNGLMNYTETIYLNNGQVEKEIISMDNGVIQHTKTYSYYDDGRIKTIAHPNGNSTEYSYSVNTENNYVVERTEQIQGQAEARIYEKEYDDADNLIRSKDRGKEIVYKYHTCGDVKEIQAPAKIITMKYDDCGNQIELTDPDAGTMEYTYNALGELTCQKDNKGNEFWLFYDDLWRLDKKTKNEDGTGIIADYTYYEEGHKKGLLKTITGIDGHVSRSYNYDIYGRTKSVEEDIAEQHFRKEYTYHENGNIASVYYPKDEVSINKSYSNNGFLEKVMVNGQKVWQLGELNATKQTYTLGNGLQTTEMYDDYGFPKSIYTDNNIQNINYTFNRYTGNLDKKSEFTFNAEKYEFDDNERLKEIKRKNGLGEFETVLAMDYDENNNMTHKSDVGDFVYDQTDNAGPHAITKIENTENSQLTTGLHDRNIDYTSFNKVAKITEANDTKKMTFMYGPEYNRKKVTYTSDSYEGYDRYYSGACEKTIQKSDGRSRTIYYISGGSGIAALYIKQDGMENLYYVHTNYLGSIQCITDQDQDIIPNSECRFDAWGNRRDPYAWDQLLTGRQDFFINRGYTGHEHIPEFNLINMNGRVYDPLTASFLSPDNYVQMPDYSLGFNRYAYALNNPLVYTDPSGECLGFIIGGALIFGYLGGAMVNETYDPTMWDWSSGETWAGIGIGAVAGGLGGWGFSAAGPALAGALEGTFGLSGVIGGYTIAGGVMGGAAGYATGFGTGMLVSHGDWGYAHKSGIYGGKVGVTIGSAIGMAYGLASEEGREYLADMFTNTPTYDLEIPAYDPGTLSASTEGMGYYGAAQMGTNPLTLHQARTSAPSNFVGNYYGAPVYESSIYNNGSAVTLPPMGIYVGEGVYGSNNLRNIMTLHHEYGHWLQYKDKGFTYYYSVIAPTSLYSAMHSKSNREHMKTWTEQDANIKAYIFFGQPNYWDFRNYPIFYIKGNLP